MKKKKKMKMKKEEEKKKKKREGIECCCGGCLYCYFRCCHHRNHYHHDHHHYQCHQYSAAITIIFSPAAELLFPRFLPPPLPIIYIQSLFLVSLYLLFSHSPGFLGSHCRCPACPDHSDQCRTGLV